MEHEDRVEAVAFRPGPALLGLARPLATPPTGGPPTIFDLDDIDLDRFTHAAQDEAIEYVLGDQSFSDPTHRQAVKEQIARSPALSALCGLVLGYWLARSPLGGVGTLGALRSLARRIVE